MEWAGRHSTARAVPVALVLLLALPAIDPGPLADAATGAAGLPADAEKRLDRIFDGTSSAFVLQDPTNDRFVRYLADRCGRRMTPFSTFKIPNTLIALETEVVRDPDAVVRWDPTKYPRRDEWPESWAKDQTLRSAFKDSVVWFYRDVAVAVGEERMAQYLERFQYGNRDISGGQDRFWLGSSLKISADEQVAFLRAFHEDRLGLSPRTTKIAKEVFVYEKKEGTTLSAKTGGGLTAPGRALGWFVGYLETEGRVYYFAMNIDGESFEAIRDKRIDLTKRALRSLGLLPEDAADLRDGPDRARDGSGTGSR